MYKNTETINPLAGECSHKCTYCYADTFKKRSEHSRVKYSGKPRLDNKGLSKLRNWNKDVFVVSMADLFAENVPYGCIERILRHIEIFSDNTYLLQTKNPARYFNWLSKIEALKSVILGVTLETDKYHNISKAPAPIDRAWSFSKIKNIDKFVSIEPNMFQSEQIVKNLDLLSQNQIK